MMIEPQNENDCMYAYLYNEQDKENLPEGRRIFNESVFRCQLFGLCLGKCEKYIKEVDESD